MKKDYEIGLLATYLLNATKAWQTNPQWILSLAKITEFYSGEFGLNYDFPSEAITGKKNKSENKPKTKLASKDIENLQDYLAKVVNKVKPSLPSEEYVFLEKLFVHLEFDTIDRRIAELLLLSSTGALGYFFSGIESERLVPTSLEIISAFLNEDRKVLRSQLKPEAALLNSGMIYVMTRDYDGELVTDRLTYYLHNKILQTIDNEEFEVSHAIDRLIGKVIAPETEWSDFEHIRTDAEYAAKIIAGALKEKTRGVNLLIYGDTGTGKTEFCRTLAAHLKTPVYAVGERAEEEPINDDFDEESGRRDASSAAARLADKKLVENMLGRRGAQALIMFDEMEDVLRTEQIRGGGRGSYSSTQLSKAATNNLLTQNDVPCLWATNNIQRFDPALLRRFAFSIELKTPNADVRQRVIERTLKRYGKALTRTQIRELADDHPVPPAFYSRAIESAALVSGHTDDSFLPDIQLGLRSIGRIVTSGPVIKVPRPVEQYDLGLVNTRDNLGELTKQIVVGKHRNFSICAYGVSGAGKSEFLVYLAHQMNLEAMLVPYSDVGSEYVSVTEQNVRMRFEQASDEGKFLIFDEADSLLSDRQGARHSWEKTLVNEMLTRMERHKFPLGCTTNLMDDIDKAALRRFVFKIKFNGLTHDQSRKAYHAYFGHDLPAHIHLPDVIAPGDFSNVLRQAKILGTKDDPKWLVRALRAECEDKGAARPIGFGASLESRPANGL